jgi:serine/threonine protein kinase
MPPAPKIAPGSTLEGRFRVVSEIGRGGMSVVYQALDLGDGGRAVAIKAPRPQFSSGVGGWSMFQREAEIGAQLHHPSILRFIAAAPGTRRPYVVTEYLTGEALSARVGKGRRLSEAEALPLMARICEAVGYLHRQGFVHYDLKPNNVIVCEDGSLRIIDLGLAHEVVRASLAFLAPAPAIATSEYVAPEQIRRRRGQRSVDIYALGAMLYEMLTGRPPFEGDDPFVIASARQIGDPPAPREICPDLSEVAEEIVLRALRRDPAERYPSAEAFQAALEDPSRVHVCGLARRLVPVTPLRRGLRLLRFVALTTVVPVLALAGMFVLLWGYLARAKG